MSDNQHSTSISRGQQKLAGARGQPESRALTEEPPRPDPQLLVVTCLTPWFLNIKTTFELVCVCETSKF